MNLDIFFIWFVCRMLTPNTLFGVNSVNKGFIGLDALEKQTYNEKPFSTHYFWIECTLNRIFTPITQNRDIPDYIVLCERIKHKNSFISVYSKWKHWCPFVHDCELTKIKIAISLVNKHPAWHIRLDSRHDLIRQANRQLIGWLTAITWPAGVRAALSLSEWRNHCCFATPSPPHSHISSMATSQLSFLKWKQSFSA